jgi:hypothetical protein
LHSPSVDGCNGNGCQRRAHCAGSNSGGILNPPKAGVVAETMAM